MKFITNGVCLVLLAGMLLSCSKSEPQDPELPSVGSASFQIVEDNVNGEEFIVIGSGQRNMVMAFSSSLNGEKIKFKTTDKLLPVIMEDDRGNSYDVFGKVIAGPNKDQRLEGVNAGMGFWFSFASRYPGMELHNGEIRNFNVDLTPDEDWLIPIRYVAQGSGFDAIQSIQEPKFEEFVLRQQDPDEKFYIDNNDLVVIVEILGEQRVYPISILNWHEIINDEIQGVPISVTHCPLTGTTKVWKRPEFLQAETFGVTGLIYMNNLLAFDRATLSYWTQLEGLCVFGDHIGRSLEMIPHIETTWLSWLTYDPSPLVMTEDTGINRDYNEYPYGGYRTNHNSISYPLAVDDDRLLRKERVFCVEIDGQAKAYRLNDF